MLMAAYGIHGFTKYTTSTFNDDDYDHVKISLVTSLSVCRLLCNNQPDFIPTDEMKMWHVNVFSRYAYLAEEKIHTQS